MYWHELVNMFLRDGSLFSSSLVDGKAIRENVVWMPCISHGENIVSMYSISIALFVMWRLISQTCYKLALQYLKTDIPECKSMWFRHTEGNYLMTDCFRWLSTDDIHKLSPPCGKKNYELTKILMFIHAIDSQIYDLVVSLMKLRKTSTLILCLQWYQMNSWNFASDFSILSEIRIWPPSASVLPNLLEL